MASRSSVSWLRVDDTSGGGREVESVTMKFSTEISSNYIMSIIANIWTRIFTRSHHHVVRWLPFSFEIRGGVGG